MKQKKKALFFVILLSLTVLFASLPLQSVQAAKYKGEPIYGNGTWGVYIDIYSKPFTDYADPSFPLAVGAAQYAYGGEGCAWFAASRVNQVTGVDCIISSGERWYNERYAWYGFKRGKKLPTSGKALACFGHHVNVIEVVDGDQYLVSEGGIGMFSDHGCCVMRVKTADQVRHDSSFGDFLGFVYLGDVAPVFRTDKMPDLPTLISRSVGIRLTWNAYDEATGYRIYRSEDPSAGWTKLDSTKKTTYLDSTAESGKLYYYTVRAYHKENGETLWSKWNTKGTAGAYIASAQAPSVKASDGKLTVSWSGVTGAQGYYLFRKTEGGSYIQTATLDPDQKKYADTTVVSGTTYLYKAVPFTNITGSLLKGSGADSTAVMAYKTPDAPDVTSLYETLSADSTTLGATVWFRGTDAGDYTVYRRVKGTTKWKKVQTVSYKDSGWDFGTDRYYSVTDTAVKKGKTYEYTVSAHRKVAGHDLTSNYGKKRAGIYVAGKELLSLLSSFEEYGDIWKASTRVYRAGNKKNQTSLLKKLYTDPACATLNDTPYKKAVTYVSGGKVDPFGKFGGSYVKINEKAIRWTAKNIFHIKPADVTAYRSTLLDNKKAGKAYIKGSNFYTAPAGRGSLAYSPRLISVTQKKNGYYYVKYRIEDNFGGRGITELQCAVMKLEKIDGTAYWTMYTHNTGSCLAP